MKKVLMIDPASGWMYGFPKIDDWDCTKETRTEWWIRKGYPESLLKDGQPLYCRYWEQEVED